MNKSKNKIPTSLYLEWIKCSLLKGGWAPVLVFGINMLVYFLGLYQKYLHADVPVHFLGGIAITFFYYKSISCALQKKILGSPSSLLIRFFLFTLICFTVVFWEFLEWIMEALFQLKLQVGLEDTLFDMLLGILGGTFIIIIKWKGTHELSDNSVKS